MATILVLVHTHDRFLERDFLLRGLFEHWDRAGHLVRLHRGTRQPPPADVAILHVDRTVVPEIYLDVMKGYPVTVNAATGDIRKRRVSQHLVSEGDGYEGPVIVKTDLNAGGYPEWVHQEVDRGRGVMPERPVRLMKGRYPVFTSAREVPEALFRDPDVVVERFLPERDERGYYLRTWVFFGDRERCNRVLGPHPVVKAEDVIERVPVPVPDELRAIRARLGFDYGKMDFALYEGKPVLYDANRTPSGAPRMSAALAAGMAHLAEGIGAFLGR
jgi:hypothetical protein